MWISIIIISLFGTLLHFLYNILNQNKIVGLFSAVNESTWEHIKNALTPTFFWGLIDGYKFGLYPNYFPAKLCSLLTITVVIPLIYYSYKVITKKDITIINISSFYIAIILSQYVFKYIIELSSLDYIYRYISCVGLFIFFGCYLLLTLLPPKIFLFEDPITKKYGYKEY